MDVSKLIKRDFLKIIVKTNCSKTEIVGFDDDKKALRVNVMAPPVKGKANAEIVKYFSRLSKKKVEIKSGKSSREKLLRIF